MFMVLCGLKLPIYMFFTMELNMVCGWIFVFFACGPFLSFHVVESWFFEWVHSHRSIKEALALVLKACRKFFRVV